MVTKRVCLHLGMHKTATSLVQRYLGQPSHPGRDAGIWHVGRACTARLIGWGPALIERPHALTVAVAREASRRECEVVLISHENVLGRPFASRKQLYAQSGPAIDALAEALADFTVDVVVAMRPQSGFVESYYLQRVQEGLAEPFEVFRRRLDETRLSYRPLIESLERAFPRARLKLVDFRRLRHGQSAFLHYFFDAVRPGHALDTTYEVRHNASLSEKGLQIALTANEHLSTKQERELVRQFLQEHFSNAHHPRATLLSPESRERLDARYADENDALLATHPVAG